jgi:Tfp pilus assembly protein PilN
VSQQVNLFQPIFRKQQKKFSATAMLQATGAVAGGIALMAAYSLWQVSELRADLKQAERQLTGVTKRFEEVSRTLGQQPKVRSAEEEIAELERALAGRAKVREILSRGIFSNTEGFSPYFTAFARRHVAGVWLTGLDITGAAEQMTLAGRATEPSLVPRYLQRLSSEKRLSGIEFHVFQMNRPGADGKNPAAYVEFTARTNPAPAAGTTARAR